MIQKKQKYFSFALDVMPLRQEMWGEKKFGIMHYRLEIHNKTTLVVILL